MLHKDRTRDQGGRTIGSAVLGMLLFLLLGCAGCGRQALRETAPAANPASAQEGASALLEQGDRTFQSREYDEARRLYELAAAEAEAAGRRSIQVEALAQVARCFSIQGQGERGESVLNRAAALARESEPLGWSRYRLVLGVYLRESGDRPRATETFMDLYEYCLGRGLHERAVNAAHMVATAADLETQLVWGRKGIAAAEAGGFQDWLGPLWNNLGWTYDDLGRYEEALHALIRARAYHYSGGDDHAKLVADWSVGHAHRMVGELPIAREWMTDVYVRAERRYAQEPTPSRAEWVGHAARELGEIEFAEGDVQRAADLVRTALTHLKEARMMEWDPEGFEALLERSRQLRAR